VKKLFILSSLAAILLAVYIYVLPRFFTVPIPDFSHSFCREHCGKPVFHLYPWRYVDMDKLTSTGVECFCTWNNKEDGSFTGYIEIKNVPVSNGGH
jgi:hypothetical protein